jgi:hypothetical protein
MSPRNKDIHPMKLDDNLFGLMALSWHSYPPSSYPQTYFKVAQFNGGMSRVGHCQGCQGQFEISSSRISSKAPLTARYSVLNSDDLPGVDQPPIITAEWDKRR